MLTFQFKELGDKQKLIEEIVEATKNEVSLADLLHEIKILITLKKLEKHNGNIAKSAKDLKSLRSTLNEFIQKNNLKDYV